MIVWFCNDFENKASQGELEMWKELTPKERDLETYGGETKEWKEAQLHYGNVTHNLERK